MMKVPYLSREQIERDAMALIVEYEQARGIIVEPMIPIEDAHKGITGTSA